MPVQLSWPGFNDKGVVIIELAADSFTLGKNSIELLGQSFTPKKEFHVTLIGSKLGFILQQKIQQDQTINMLLIKTSEKIDWSYAQSGSVYILSRLKKNDIQQSIIVSINMPGVTEFYDQLKSFGLIDLATPVPPPHVTLYTHHCPLGIAVPNAEVLDEISVKTLTVKELIRLTGRDFG